MTNTHSNGSYEEPQLLSQEQSQSESSDENPRRSQLIDAISTEGFDSWYRERQFAKNIEEGTPYFNGVADPKAPERHSPSQLLKCHRQTYYAEFNAPEEEQDPHGIFWIGNRFEDDIVVPYLRSLTGEDEYVTNSLWVDQTEETPHGSLRIKGETDPVIVDEQSDPVLLTEIKTRNSIENLTGASEHHRAQVHAYMRGLTASETYDGEVRTAVIIYGARTSLKIKAFAIEFDESFWQDRVLDWAETQTEYQAEDELPAGEPEQEWECKFCGFRERCGKGDLLTEDEGVTGLLPSVEYPRAKLEDYLRAHPTAQLIPTLAYQYPDLAATYGVYDWSCSRCGTTKSWDDVTWSPQSEHYPECEHCAEDDRVAVLSPPKPTDQGVTRGQNDE